MHRLYDIRSLGGAGRVGWSGMRLGMGRVGVDGGGGFVGGGRVGSGYG